QVKILDFGLCRLMPATQELTTESLHLTDPGMVLGTLAYMSPEQLEAREGDHRTDIYSFGVLLYELATGVHPFAGASAASTIANVLTVEPIPLAKLKAGLPSGLAEVVSRCMRKKPDQRYQSVEELLRDLEQVDAEESGDDPQQASWWSRWFSREGRTPRQWWEGNQVLCLIAFPLVGYLVWRLRDWLPLDWAALLLAPMIVLVAATTTMRMYLLLTAVFDPPSLRVEVRRWSLPLRAANSVIWLLLATVAG